MTIGKGLIDKMRTSEKIAAKIPARSGWVADLKKNKVLYLLMIPVLAYYAVFCYKPMLGAVIAFQNYSPALGILKSQWVGLNNFKDFFSNPDFIRIFKNTIIISMASLIFGFPAPIILALLFNEIRNETFKRTAQTISYLPHFISMVVICGLIKQFVSNGGIIHQIITSIGGEQPGLLSNPKAFVPIYVISGIWQEIGWGSIIYLATLSGIDQALYEAARMDGAGRFKQVIHVTIPGIMPTIVTMLILRLGQIFSIGYEKIILLYNPSIYSTSDIISTYVYRVGIANQSWSYSTAVGLFNSILNFILVVLANYTSKHFTETSLW